MMMMIMMIMMMTMMMSRSVSPHAARQDKKSWRRPWGATNLP